jgi:CspA family cold shock protein
VTTVPPRINTDIGFASVREADRLVKSSLGRTPDPDGFATNVTEAALDFFRGRAHLGTAPATAPIFCLDVSPTTLQPFRRTPREQPEVVIVPRHAMRAWRDVYCLLPKEAFMATGTVKWFNPTKGFGFIVPSDGSKDVFVHISAVQRAGMQTLNEGQKVSYELATERGRTAAVNIKAA